MPKLTAVDLRREAAALRHKAAAIVALAVDEDRELTADESSLLAELIGDPAATGGKLGGEIGRKLAHSEILDRLETAGAISKASRVQGVAPLAGGSALTPAAQYSASLRSKYGVSSN